MKYFGTEDQRLDELLADPATLADQGFVNRVKVQIDRKRKQRKAIFAGAGCAWFAVALVFLSPQSVSLIYQRLLSMATRTDELISAPDQVDLVGLFTSQSNLLPVLVLALGFYALLYTQLRD